MMISIFTDELKIEDIVETLDIIRSWGMQWVDFRKNVFGKLFFDLDADETCKVTISKQILDHLRTCM